MTDKHIDQIAQIEESQAVLRESIAATKELAERADDLLHRYKARADSEGSPGQGEPPQHPELQVSAGIC